MEYFQRDIQAAYAWKMPVANMCVVCDPGALKAAIRTNNCVLCDATMTGQCNGYDSITDNDQYYSPLAATLANTRSMSVADMTGDAYHEAVSEGHADPNRMAAKIAAAKSVTWLPDVCMTCASTE